MTTTAYIDRFGNLAEILRSIEPALEAKIAYCRSHVPSPAAQPATSVIVQAYVTRLEIQLSAIRAGAPGLKDEYKNHPMLTEEIKELESWITRRMPDAPRWQLTEKDEDVMGDWLVKKQGLSYSHAKRQIQAMRAHLSGRGAPSKRPETLKILDARIVHGWSYAEIAKRMCDCGATEHTSYCSERIRKRLKELKSILSKFGVQLPTAPEKNRP
jgi:hypothetical protein